MSVKKHKIQITVADNGYIVEDNYSDEPLLVVEFNYEKEYPEVHGLKDLLQTISNSLGHGSRYDDQRVYIIVRPGDKNHKFTSKDSEVIWGEPKDALIEIYEEENDDQESS